MSFELKPPLLCGPHRNADCRSAPNDGLLYFSLTTLTTLGDGDITPVSAVARIWASFEAATGSLHLAVLIARLESAWRPATAS